jgi:sigma-B regulation protein RsbQ
MAPEEDVMEIRIERQTCLAPDGVEIVYSVGGSGEPALVFIHGGLAERSFYDGQIRAFSVRHRVVALDLAGHGDSGADRTMWGIPEFAEDVRAVVDAEGVRHCVLFGNSLGGPVAIEAGLILAGRALGVVGIDTFQSLDYTFTAEQARERADAFRRDYSGTVREMIKALFHPDADPALVADAEARMQKTPPAAAYAIFLSLAGYDQAAPARKLAVPLRAINGDLYPTDVRGVRKHKADFDAAIMPHMGHYPMLEQPEEFNRLVADVIQELTRST